MRRISCVSIAAFVLGATLRLGAAAMPVEPLTVTLWDVPNSGLARGTASFQGLPRGVAVQVSLKAAGPGPDTAFIATGTCTVYKRIYALKPIRDGLSNTTLPTAGMVKLFGGKNVVVVPELKYCGALKNTSVHETRPKQTLP
ncbi:MAG TPA: hypothetical protein VFW34_08360 [Candidatus Rubrimentiphilum sp.]|nr:hypothetical protein [Candidatus Rubrimentiphilum sp.]